MLTTRQFFYLLCLLSVLVLVYVVDYFVGQVYARYVIIYTGAIFLLGLLVGQRTERNWLARQRTAKRLTIKRPIL